VGGLVGVLGYPELIDGGVVTAPVIRFLLMRNGFGIEKRWVHHQILEAEQMAGRCCHNGKRSLNWKKQIVILDELKKNPLKPQAAGV
jgi:tricorn protease